MIAAILLAGAVAAQPPIVVRDQAAVAGCKILGEVRASSMLGGAMANAGYDRALNSLKQKAASMGATHIQLLDSASGMTGARMLGTAYRCEQEKPAG